MQFTLCMLPQGMMANSETHTPVVAGTNNNGSSTWTKDVANAVRTLAAVQEEAIKNQDRALVVQSEIAFVQSGNIMTVLEQEIMDMELKLLNTTSAPHEVIFRKRKAALELQVTNEKERWSSS